MTETVDGPGLLAIHDSPTGFHPRWVAHCERHGIPFRRVDCYSNDIIQQLQGCSALMWHYGQSNSRDIVLAQSILNALEHAGVPVFPDFRTAWHFDDKVAQKFLFEALDIPAVAANVFTDRRQALEWIESADFPLVFKLRRGAGSAGVKLIRTRAQARKLVKQAFGRGFLVYDPWDSLKERFYKWRLGIFPFSELVKGLARFVHPPRYSHVLGRERGYVYFQDFLPDNGHDIRIIVIGDRAFGIRRLVRPGDFRASGSGRIAYLRADLDERCVRMAFDCADKLGSSCTALDFVYDQDGLPKILEASYGFAAAGYDACEGYWERDLAWHSGTFDPQGWMVDLVLKKSVG